MTKITVGLVEIGDSFGGQFYFPYSLGSLQAYAEQKLGSDGSYEFFPIIYKRGDINQYAAALSGADIIFYSAYLWNFQVSLEIARKIKTRKPEIVNIFGGPQVPELRERMSLFLEKYPFVDVASWGEGEVPFVQMLEHARDRRWDSVPSIGYRQADATIAFSECKETVQDLDEIPSPYLTGVFDELMRQNPHERWQARIETNRGCPFTCAFCYWGKKSDRMLRQFNLDRIYQEIEWLGRNKIEFVFCCDANFGILKRDGTIAKKVADSKKTFGYPKAFSVQNTKNSRERIFELQKILNDAGLQKGVNLALQSLHGETLHYIARSNIDNKTYTELQTLFTKSNIPTFTDLIIGLPGETYETFTQGVAEIMANGQHNRIQFINLTILENTLMATPEYQREHGFTVVEAELVPHHSSPDMMENIVETQHLVTATRSMSGSDWIRARVFSWLTSLLHFDKLLQIPFILLHEVCGISYKEIIETFMKRIGGQDLLTRIVSEFEAKAADIRQGGSEYRMSTEWLNITWYPDELMLITLSAEGKIAEFYREAEERLLWCARDYANVIEPAVITQSVLFSRSVIKQPFLAEDITLSCDYSLWEVYQAALKGEHTALEKGRFTYLIDRSTQCWTSWEEWCREVIWYGNKKGDYIYSVKRSVS